MPDYKTMSESELKQALIGKKNELNEAKQSYERSDDVWVKESKGLIEKLFETWSTGGKWIKDVHKQGRKNITIFSLIGMPRHLWAYLHASESIQAAMDRRGPNSAIQGFSSQSGFVAAWCIAREVWRTFTRKGIDLGFQQHNAVHDSMVFESYIYAIPIALYLIEHGMTTLVIRHYKQVYNADIAVPFGMGLELGVSEADMVEWEDQRFDTMAKYIRSIFEKSMARQEAFLSTIEEGEEINWKGGRRIDESDLRASLHNLELIAAVRCKELRIDPFMMLLEGNTAWYEKNMKGLIYTNK